MTIQQNHIKTITIVKKARKYFDITLPNQRRAKLLINDISRDFAPGQTLDVEIKDISEVTPYGVILKYEPLGMINETERVRRRVRAGQGIETTPPLLLATAVGDCGSA